MFTLQGVLDASSTVVVTVNDATNASEQATEYNAEGSGQQFEY